MDVRFDYKGAPNGGCILNYLLEKSRVIRQAGRERNFHIFYQLICGASQQQLDQWALTRDSSRFAYLNSSEFSTQDTVEFGLVCKALEVIAFFFQ